MKRLAALLLVAACSKGADKPAPGSASARPQPMGEVERQRGDDACQAYVDRLCKCADAQPPGDKEKDLEDRCQLKHGKLEALQMTLQVDDDPKATARDVFIAQDQARKIIARCIEENEALDQECPP